MSDSGRIIVISAPSGGGKGTIIGEVMGRNASLVYSVSATTRAPRPGERNGRDYLFVTEEEFKQWIKDDLFVEWAKVHDHFYGTPKDLLADLLKAGHDVILEVDIQGARQVKKMGLGEVITIFIAPPSLEILEQRLRDRGDVNEDQVRTRLENAREEMAAQDEYDHVVINDDLSGAVEKVETILRKTRS